MGAPSAPRPPGAHVLPTPSRRGLGQVAAPPNIARAPRQLFIPGPASAAGQPPPGPSPDPEGRSTEGRPGVAGEARSPGAEGSPGGGTPWCRALRGVRLVRAGRPASREGARGERAGPGAAPTPGAHSAPGWPRGSQAPARAQHPGRAYLPPLSRRAPLPVSLPGAAPGAPPGSSRSRGTSLARHRRLAPPLPAPPGPAPPAPRAPDGAAPELPPGPRGPRAARPRARPVASPSPWLSAQRPSAFLPGPLASIRPSSVGARPGPSSLQE